MTTVSTSVIISFDGESSGADGIFSAEVDSREDGYNGGKSSFIRGDSPVVLLFASTGIEVTKIVQSEGAYTNMGLGSMQVEEFITFANERTAELPRPYLSGLQILGGMPTVPPGLTLLGDVITLPTKMVAVLKVSFITQFRAYRITNVSGDYPVVMYFEGVMP